jgi:fido (protein-threonine AMPylation protein)
LPLPWNEDPPAARRQIEQNIATVLHCIRDEADLRNVPAVSMAQQWHRDVYRGVPLPVDYYAGEVRDTDPRFPELIGYEVAVDALRGCASADVPVALSEFEQSMQTAIRAVDTALPTTRTQSRTARQLVGVVQLASQAHGEWIRIHPFANGNGRTARLWVAWLAARYGLPLFLQLKPRPEGNAYAFAAGASMRGDHRPMQLYLGDSLARALREIV